MTRTPAVTTIIVFLDEARFLEEAIESVLAQTFDDWELLLVDDGSTDGSTEIARRYAAEHPSKVRYVDHEGHSNEGMSASRNLGLSEALGTYIAWLDGDDVWLPKKLEEQVAILERYPEAAMVYGPLHVWYGWSGKQEDRQKDYLQNLGVSAETLIRPPELLTLFLRDDRTTPGGELVRRSVLEAVGGFDSDFRGMYEDGVVHAKICLEHPVYASGQCWYRYRQHPDSCCNQAVAKGEDVEARLTYLRWLENLLKERADSPPGVLATVRKELRSRRPHPGSGSRDEALSWARRALRQGRRVSDRIVPGWIRRSIGLLAFGRRAAPPSGWAHFGNLRRITPISSRFGFDRGTPIDRYYMHRFLAANADDIHGSVLEVADADYTRRFGGARVTESHVLHARPGNPEATLVADLNTGEGVPTSRFDCIVLTQVLPFVWDPAAALHHLHRALRPNGVLLATFPGISQISRYDADRWGDFWRFTSMSARRLFEDEFGRSRVDLATVGNVLAATALLQGIAAEELSEPELYYVDPDYEVILTVRARRDPEIGGPGS